MGQNTKTAATSYENLYAGDFPVVTDGITLLAGMKYYRGDVIGVITIGGKGTLCAGPAATTPATDGSEVGKYILLEDTDATAGDLVAPVALTGDYQQNGLRVAEGDTVAAHVAELRTLSIFAHKVAAVS